MDVVLNKLVNLDLGGKTITGNVSMTSATTGRIDIKNGTITGDLTVNAENATVNNSATVNGTITIADVSSGTWNQKAAHTGEIVFNATDKTLNISANVGTLTINKKATVTVDEGKTVSDIAVAETAADTAITNNGTVSSMTIDAKTTVTSATKIKATIKDTVEVVVKETAEDTGNTVIGTGEVVEDIKVEAEYGKILPKNITKSNISTTNAMNLKFSKDIPLSTFDGLSVSILNQSDEILATNTLNKAGFYLYANTELDENFVKKVSERNRSLVNFGGRADELEVGAYAAWKPDGDTTGNLTVRPFKVREEKYEGAPKLDDDRIEVVLGWDMDPLTNDKIVQATQIRLTLVKNDITYEYTQTLNN